MVDASKSNGAGRPHEPTEATANDRAGTAAEAIGARHLKRFACLPGTRLAAIAWPSSMFPGVLGRWHYWWQAHLVDLLVDAAIHRPTALADDAQRLLRGIVTRNFGRWTNNYFDDMAWLGLALERADRHLGVSRDAALRTLTSRVHDAWVPHLGGGIPWRTMDLFFNAPANGPAAILLTRTGHVDRAVEMADWMDANLVDHTTGLILDGVHPALADSPRRLVPDIYTYCQGVVLGTELELLRRTGDAVHRERLDRLLHAVETHVCDDGVIPGAGGGDGGLFAGILARNLALIATDLPESADGGAIRSRAAAIVTTSAAAAWTHRHDTDQGPVFGPDWRHQAHPPRDEGRKSQFSAGSVRSSQIPERDLSVQLSGWMVLEAAAAVTLNASEHDETDAP